MQAYIVTSKDNLDENNQVIDENLLGLVVDLQKITSVSIDEKTQLPSQTEKIMLCVVWPHQPGTAALTFYEPSALCFVELFDQNTDENDEIEDYEDQDDDNLDN